MLLISSLALAVSPSLSSTPAEMEFVFCPREGTTRITTIEFQRSKDVDDAELTLNQDQTLMSGGGTEQNEERSARIRDHFAKVEAGHGPLRIERTFEALERDVSFEGLQENAVGRKGTLDSPLEGLSIAYEREGTGEDYVAEWMEEEGDDEWLEDLEEDMSLRGLLPRDAVSVGDAWDIDPEVLGSVLSTGGQLWPEESGDDGDIPPGALTIKLPRLSMKDRSKAYEGVLRATFTGLREVDGLELAVVEVAVDLRSETDDTEGYLDEGSEQEYDSFDLERSLGGSGTLLWDSTAGALHSFEMELETEQQIDTAWSTPFAGGSAELAYYSASSGTISIQVSSAPEEL